MNSNDEIKSAIKVKVASLLDFVRLIITWSAHRTIPTVMYFQIKNRHIYTTFTVISNYFDLKGLPILVYYEDDKPPEGAFIAYFNEPKEEITFKKGIDDRKYKYIPIIKLEEPLPIYED